MLNRRDWLKRAAAAVAASAVARTLPAVAQSTTPAGRKRVLFFTKSSGYEHEMIARHGKLLAPAEKILTDLGAAMGLDVLCSKDGTLFTPDQLAVFSIIAFYTTGDLSRSGTDGQPPMPAGGKQALLGAISGGTGFVGIHSASDTFHSPKNGPVDPYLAMLGGEFVTHGKQQQATCRVMDRTLPGLTDRRDLTLLEEWYVLDHFAPDLHPVLQQETADMQGAMYERPPYPCTWTRRHGKGHVFYTSLGHRAEVWDDDTFRALLGGGLQWAGRRD